MEYRYYIYRQSLIPTNFNKYDFTQYDYVREITNNSQWSLNIERNSDWFTVIRQEFNGDISVSGADYDALITYEGTPYQYAIVIHRKCEGVYSEFWKGYFSYFDYKVDMDRCLIHFTPTVWDAYSPVFDQMEIEYNALVADTSTSVFMDSYEFPIEEVIESLYYLGPPANAFWFEYNYNPTYYPAGNQFYLYQQTRIRQEESPTPGIYIYHVLQTFRREYLINGGANPGGAWVLDPLLDGPGELVTGVEYKWVRPFLDVPNPPTGPAVYNSVDSGNDRIETMINALPSTVNINGGIYLNSVFELYADICGLDYVSNFFEDDPCPTGGVTLEKTMLNHISNIRGVAEVATKGMLKLKDLLSWIRDTFDAYWYIDSNGDFRIEHRQYFDLGLDYSPFVYPTIELDLGVLYPVHVEAMRRYEWKEPELYKFERLDMQWMYLLDWTDPKIEYPQYSIQLADTKTKSVQWSSDLVGMLDNQEDLPKKGWVLMDVELRGGGVLIPYIRNATGAYSGSLVPNGRFSPANLYAAWWTYGRLLPTGKVNGNTVTFSSIEKLRQQAQLTIPQCCQDIDYNGVFRTPLGDGIIDKAEYESKTGNLKINLIYE